MPPHTAPRPTRHDICTCWPRSRPVEDRDPGKAVKYKSGCTGTSHYGKAAGPLLNYDTKAARSALPKTRFFKLEPGAPPISTV